MNLKLANLLVEILDDERQQKLFRQIEVVRD